MRRQAPPLALVIGFATALVAPRGRAESPAPAPHVPQAEEVGRGEDRDHLRQTVLDQMRVMRVWKLTEELKLDQATAAKVFPLLAQFDERARAIGQERREAMRALAEELRGDKPDAGKLTALTERAQANRARRDALEAERWKALGKVLTPVQHAKLLLFLPRFEEGFRRRIHEVWEEQHRGPDDPPSGGGRRHRQRRGSGEDPRF